MRRIKKTYLTLKKLSCTLNKVRKRKRKIE